MDSETAAALRDLRRRISRLETKTTPLYLPGGTFVPTWAGSTIAGTFTYTATACLVEWTIVGDRLHYNGRIGISAIGVAPTGTLTITGWPYAAVADTGMNIAGGGAFIAWALNVAAGYTDVGLQFTQSGGAVGGLIRSGDNVAIANVAGGELIVGDCRFAGSYRIA